MTTTFCDSGAVKYKAGANCSSTITGDDTALTQFINQAENFICVATKNNYIDSYSGLNADVKKILEETASNLAAYYVLSYDMSGLILSEAALRLNVLWDKANQNINLLKDKDYIAFINSA